MWRNLNPGPGKQYFSMTDTGGRTKVSARNPDSNTEFEGDSRLESGYASLDGERQDISKAGGTGNENIPYLMINTS